MASFPKDADIPMPLSAVFDWLVTNRPDCVMPVGRVLSFSCALSGGDEVALDALADGGEGFFTISPVRLSSKKG